METKSKSKGILEDAGKRIVLAHMEHLKSIGEAFTNAASVYQEEHAKSEATGGWETDLADNVRLAGRELHRGLFAVPKRVIDRLGAYESKDTTCAS